MGAGHFTTIESLGIMFQAAMVPFSVLLVLLALMLHQKLWRFGIALGVVISGLACIGFGEVYEDGWTAYTQYTYWSNWLVQLGWFAVGVSVLIVAVKRLLPRGGHPKR